MTNLDLIYTMRYGLRADDRVITVLDDDVQTIEFITDDTYGGPQVVFDEGRWCPPSDVLAVVLPGADADAAYAQFCEQFEVSA